ncbi:MAG: carboxypeptidase regulatory-like domain-containing protein [Planctomycetota bacterium]
MSRDVLEHNLQRLLTRAYVPVKPRAAFADALRRELRAELEPRARPRAQLRAWRPVLAAAAALFVVGLVYVWTIARAPTTPAPVVANGANAVRSLASTHWRALSADESSQGIECTPPGVEIATAAASTARVWVGSEGRVDVLAASAARIEHDDAGQSAVHLDEGALALERYGGAELTVHTTQGEVALERGVLSVAYASPPRADGEPTLACVRLRLESGIAWALQGGGRTLLGLDTDVYLCGGRVLTAAARFDFPSATREPLAPASATDLAAGDEAPHARTALAGRVHAANDAPLAAHFDVFLLPVVRLPDVAQAHRATFSVASSATEARFAFTTVADGVYTVFVQAPGFAVWQASGVEIENGRASTELDVALERGSPVSGRVVDAATGTPIANAFVLVESDVPAQLLPFHLGALGAESGAADIWSACTTTGPDGSFELAHMSRGRHLLRASAPGYAAAWSDPFDVGLSNATHTVSLALGTGGTVFGSVAHDDGTPFAGAHVVASYVPSDPQRQRLNFGYALADDAGRFTIQDLPAGSFVVLETSASARSGKSAHVVQVHVEAGKRTQVDLPGRVRGTRLVGRVERADGSPVADADVTVLEGGTGSSGWQAARTDADGRYVFPGLRSARYELYLGREFGRNIVAAATIDVPDAAEYTHDLRVSTTTLRGLVKKHADDAPLAEAVVILEREEQSVNGGFTFAGRGFSDRRGRFALEWLPPGRYRATAFPTRGRLAPARSELFTVADRVELADIVLALAPGAALEVHVRDAVGHAVARAAVDFVDERGAVMQHTIEDVTDARGRLSVPAMSPGRWTIRVRAAGFALAERALELEVGELERVELMLAQ